MSEVIGQYLPTAILVVGILAFVVSVIVEVTKGISILKDIPTDAEVLGLSIALTVASFAAYAMYSKIAVVWYMIVGSVIGGFFVAFVAMYGWSKLTELWSRFNKND